jgi:hypothetical protein
MKKITMLITMLLITIWLKNSDITAIFCTSYQKMSQITIAYQNEDIIAIIGNSQIARIEE